MSELKKMTIHSSKYFSLGVVTMGISMITFPIFTRLLSVEEYGFFALANTTISIALSFSKSGISTSFAKEYPTYEGKDINLLYSTSFWLQCQCAIVISCIYIILIILFRNLLDEFLTKVLLLVSPLLALRTLQALLLGFYRTEEKVDLFNKVSFIFRMGTSIFGIAGLALISEKVLGFFLGATFFESIMVCYLVMRRRFRLLLKDYSGELGLNLLKYGAPLVVYEMSSLIISYADRYQITHYLGAQSLGFYSAGYNLCIYLDNLVSAPMWMAIFPIYTKMWIKEGEEKTKEFLSTCLKYYFALSIPIIFGGAAIGKDLIQLLASEKYSSASEIIPFVLAGLLVYSSYPIAAAGLYLHGKTKNVAIATLLCALLNVALNIYFIPLFGVVGAAYTTLIVNILLLIIITVNAFRYLPITIPLKDIAFYTLFSLIMNLIITSPDIAWRPGRILFMIATGCIVYIFALFSYDKVIRLFVANFVVKRFSR